MAARGRHQDAGGVAQRGRLQARLEGPAYHGVVQILHNPLYAGAYAFGRRAQRTEITDGRARKINRLSKPREEWSVLLRDNHPCYISWQEYKDNQILLLENAHMKKNCARKSARGDRALLTVWCAADDAAE